MMKLIYKNTFDNIKTGDKIPQEDKIYATDTEAIIADGITRDPIGISDFSKASFDEIINNYPNPSGAAIAAEEIINTFKISTGTLKERMIKCNERVKEINDKYIKKCDYLENDYYAAVAASIKIDDNKLHYSYICDCGVIVYDKLGNIKFQTNDDKALIDPYINNQAKKNNVSWNLKEARVLVRKEFRNNINNIVDGKCASYGAFTGEESAKYFIKEGEVLLDDEDTIVIYSDGFANFLLEKEFFNNIINFNEKEFIKYLNKKEKEDINKFGSEKTIAIYR